MDGQKIEDRFMEYLWNIYIKGHKLDGQIEDRQIDSIDRKIGRQIDRRQIRREKIEERQKEKKKNI